LTFDDPVFSSPLLRTIAETLNKAASIIGECFTTAYHIKEKDFERCDKYYQKRI
jgi:hypothetical protein